MPINLVAPNTVHIIEDVMVHCTTQLDLKVGGGSDGCIKHFQRLQATNTKILYKARTKQLSIELI